MVKDVFNPKGNRALRLPEEDLRVPVIELSRLDSSQDLAAFIEVLLQGQPGPVVIMKVEREFSFFRLIAIDGIEISISGLLRGSLSSLLRIKRIWV